MSKSNNTNKIKFQAIDFRSYDGLSDDSTDETFIIEIFGKMLDGKTVYCKIINFTPYFFVKIPRHWSKNQLSILIEEVNKKISKDNKKSLKKSIIVNRYEFYGFTDYKKYKFAKLIFTNYKGFRSYSYAFNNSIDNKRLSRTPKIYKLYESNIEPILRFIHITNIKSVSWIEIHKYDEIDGEKSDINISTNYGNIKPVVDDDMPPLVIASIDIECISRDRKSFPQASNKYEKIIQIGTTLNICGKPECHIKYIATLGDVMISKMQLLNHLILKKICY
jgi:DNA polymerase elongation subunit (family B)